MMMHHFTVIRLIQVISICLVWSVALAEESTVRAYCQSESFQPSCPDDHVVVMRVAKYGRLKMSRCVTKDFGYLGCEHDVLPILDSHCSGRKSCDVLVDESKFPHIEQCHKDLKSYLLADYECVKVVVPESPCIYPRHVEVTKNHGFLSSLVTEQSRCGTTESPWIIQAPPGQKLNVTLFDFNHYNLSLNPSSQARRCKVLATVRDPSALQSATACGGRERELHVYKSQTNVIEIRFLHGQGSKNPSEFLLEFKAYGCMDPPRHDFSWMQRTGDTVFFGCPGSDIKWKLSCQHGHWTGATTNCSTGVSIGSGTRDAHVISNFPFHISVIIILVTATVMCVLIVVFGLLCIRRRLRHSQRRQEIAKITTTEMIVTTDGHPSKTTPQTVHRSYPMGMTPNEYAMMQILQENQEFIHQKQNTTNETKPSGRNEPRFQAVYDKTHQCSSPEHIYESPEVSKQDLYSSGNNTAFPQYHDHDNKRPTTSTVHMDTPVLYKGSSSSSQRCSIDGSTNMTASCRCNNYSI